MKLKKLLLLVGLLICFHPGNSYAETLITLKNGDQIRGTVLSRSHPEFLEIRTSYSPSITISKSSIASTSPVSEVNDPPSEQSTLTGYIIDSTSITSFPVDGEGPIDTFARAAQQSFPATRAPSPEMQEIPEEESTDPEDYEWKGRANFGGQVQDGNTQSQSIDADAELSVRNEKNRFQFGGEYEFQKDEGEKTEDSRYIYGEYDRFLTKKWFVGTRLSFRSDEFQNLDLRTRWGVFAGYQFYERDDLNLEVKSGLDYIREDYETDESSENDIAATWALDYDQKIWEDWLQVFHNHSLSIPLDATDAFLFESKSGLRVPVGKYLVGTTEIDFDWDNDPAEGVKEEDLTYALKIGYEWK